MKTPPRLVARTLAVTFITVAVILSVVFIVITLDVRDRVRAAETDKLVVSARVFSSLEAGFGEGPLTIRAGVSAENVERTIASIDTELTAVVTNGFTQQEIDESKSYLIGSIPRQLETNGAIAAFLLNAETYGLGLDYDVRLPGLIQAVTLDDANAAARRLLDPARATIAVAGPWTPAPTNPTNPTNPANQTNPTNLTNQANPTNPPEPDTPWLLPDE